MAITSAFQADDAGSIPSYADVWCMEEKGSCGVIC